ncbi:MAG: MMPL family transporter [Thermomicrobiales bacterium]|nr:MMPL family transporter [Thermomicrobiales bacterium]
MSASTRHKPQGPLARWARFAANNPWKVISGWVVVIVVALLLSNTFGGEYAASFSLPGSESEKAVAILMEKFPEAAGDSATIVVQAKDGLISDPAVQEQLTQIVTESSALPGVVGVITPEMNPLQISEDGTIAYLMVQYGGSAMELTPEDVAPLFELVDGANSDTLRVEVGGQVASMGEIPELGNNEIYGIIAAMVIMLLMFGSVIAMGLPIITAIAGVGISMITLPIFANWFTMSSDITTAFLSMMGLGVGIDYALFIVNRYRDNLLHGQEVEDAVAVAINTAGRSVAFAGTTVAIGLLGLAVIRIPFVTGIGIAGSVVVVISVLVAIFLMPAVLGLVGRSILKWRIPGLGNGDGSRNSIWFSWGRFLQRKPGLIAIITVIFLAALATPIVDMHLGLSDAGNNPETMHTRRAYDLMAEGFGPGANGPLLVVVESESGFDQQAMMSAYMQLTQLDGVASVLPMPNEEGTAAILQIQPTTGPQDRETEELIHTLRDDFLPQMTEGTDIKAYVGGATAANIDLSEIMADRMVQFFGVVIGLSMIVLIVVFRSIFVPIKAAVTTLASVGATFGAMVAVFQWGWAQSLLGIDGTGPIESFMPMILFGVLFGLSMDYEVFLLSRVHEEHAHGVDAKAAMLDGVGYSGKVVAAAGAIMASVFLSFVLGDMRMIQMMGFGLGFAILVDAFVVRLVLVPTVMTLIGERGWWMPTWLGKILPNINIEGESDIDLEEIDVVATPAD